jgi:CDP-2,3-bis-(O-geranylgeranyl)-sn-glycerol synthase
MMAEYFSLVPDAIVAPLRALLLLAVANSAPLLGPKLFGQRLDTPLDGGWKFPDGRPLFGPSKTLRGIVLSLVATMLAALLLGLVWSTGALVAAFAMLGDLASSFIKRRLGRPPSSQAVLLDQVPESLLPLLVLKENLDLAAWDIAAVVLAFFGLELLLSRLLYKLHLRDQPY